MSLAARRARRFLRRPPPPPWRRPLAVVLVLGIGLTTVGAMAEWAIRSGLVATTGERVERGLLRWSAQAGLRIEDILLDGRLRTRREAVVQHLSVYAGQPILSVSTAELKSRLEDLTWVEQAEVARLLPNRIHVRLIERRPLAFGQRQGRLALIDHAGRVLPVRGDRPDLLQAFGSLRIVIGEGAPERAPRLFAVLSSEPELWSRVAALTLVGERRWNLRLADGIDVMLPADDLLGAWRRLARFAREDDLLERAVVEIDLRFLPERIRLRLDPALREPEKVA
ncbi:MAG: FtsQ-type POTRA domain-containing protein [Geminicoccaceae bacterium]|nr:FtsQ-type POTRA domain-containing protein [Geminicoccaceae bacterium]